MGDYNSAMLCLTTSNPNNSKIRIEINYQELKFFKDHDECPFSTIEPAFKILVVNTGEGKTLTLKNCAI